MNCYRQSIYHGWEILCCLAMTFPPSKNFEQYLTTFVKTQNQTDNDPKIKPLSRHVHEKIKRVMKNGPRGKTPTVAEIERAIEAPFNPSVFNESLEEIMRQQEAEYPTRRLPVIVPFLANAILDLDGAHTEGIFRVPGDADLITSLKLRLEKKEYDLKGIDEPAVPASLLKMWLRDLAEPVIGASIYQECIQNAEDAERAVSLIDALETCHRNVIYYVIGFLQVSTKSLMI